MTHRRIRGIPALASVLAVGIAVGGCGAATAPATATARTSAPFYGPPAPDPACVAARKAEQVMQARQGKDRNSQSAINRDFTNFASALNAAAQHETHPAVAKVMTALANDYTALVDSQSGAVPLPSMATMQSDGAAFDQACP